MSYSHETIERFNTARARMMRPKAVRALPLTALRVFEAAARHGSFTRAADELCVTQGAVSRQVQSLEARMGVRLFDRRGRKIALSLEGRMLAEAASDALERLSEAVANLSRPGGVLTISMLPSLAACWMAPRMREFAAEHPEIELRVSASRHLVDFQREGIDAAVRYGPGGWPDVASELLAREEIFPVCSPDYADRLGLREAPDLMRAILLHNDVPDGWRDWFAAAGRPDAFTEKGIYLDEDAALLRAAAEGEGIALGRSVLVADDLARGRLVAPFDLRIPASFAYWFVTPLHAAPSAKVATIRSWLMKTIAPYRRSDADDAAGPVGDTRQVEF